MGVFLFCKCHIYILISFLVFILCFVDHFSKLKNAYDQLNVRVIIDIQNLNKFIQF